MGIRALVAEVMDPLRSLSNVIVADLGIRIGAVVVGWRSMAVDSILSSSMSYVLPKLFSRWLSLLIDTCFRYQHIILYQDTKGHLATTH